MAISGGGPIALQLALRHPSRLWAVSLSCGVTKYYKYSAFNSNQCYIINVSAAMNGIICKKIFTTANWSNYYY